MDVLFLNENNLTTLDGELPIRSTNFKSLIAHHNKLQNLTQDLSKFLLLDAMYLSDNEIRSLDGVFQNASFIQTLSAHNNKIEYLAQDEFLNTIELQELDLANNFIRSLNNSLLPLKKVHICNVSRNHFAEFSLNEVRGLRELQVVDLSYNYIEKLTGHLENVVDQDLYFVELRLDHNLLKTLDGAMMNLNRLKTLDVSFNKLKWISSNYLIGLDDLESLDVSHGNLTSMTFLPKLEKLYCSYNNLSKLERDFHGLPSLCFADLSNNYITYISSELVVKTRCNSHGVINKLEILLQENPILCMDELSKLFAQMEAQETRLLGIAHCIVPKEEETPIIESVFVPPPKPLPPSSPKLPLMSPNLQENLSQTHDELHPQSQPEIEPEILPNEVEQTKDVPIVDNEKNLFNAPNEVPSVISTSVTNSASVTATDELNKEAVITTTITATEMPMPNVENDTVINSLNFISKLENVTVLEGTPATILKSSATQTDYLEVPTTSTSSPSIAEIVLGEMESVSKSPEPDNYIYETFSPISPVDIGEVSSLQRNEHLVLAEEPPEIPNDAVSPA